MRKKSNRSGSTNVVVIEIQKGKVSNLKMIGISSNANEIDELYAQGKTIRVKLQKAKKQSLRQCYLLISTNLLLYYLKATFETKFALGVVFTKSGEKFTQIITVCGLPIWGLFSKRLRL